MKRNIHYPRFLIVALALVATAFLPHDRLRQSYTKVLGMPPGCEAPLDRADIFSVNFQPDKKAREGWMVISDREGNILMNKPGGTANGRKMKFRDIAYVVDQFPENKGEWLHIVQAKVAGREIIEPQQVVDLGWIRRENVMLWRNGLRSNTTNIHLKAFTLNKLKDIKNIINEGKRDILSVYNGPTGAGKLSEKTVYEFYFIYKKENDRFLLGKESALSSGRMEQDLVGWVEERRIADWSTRLALEPNFEDAAYTERYTKPEYRVVAYEDYTPAEGHANKGIKGKPFWTADPVTLKKGELPPNSKRFPGGVVRFPMLQNYGYTTCRTGIIGDIKIKSVGSALDSMKEILYSRIIDEKDRLIRAKQNFDVIFLVEGTPSMEDYRKSLANLLKTIPGTLPSDINLRTSVAIYRDEPAGDANLFEYTTLSDRIGEASAFLENAKFERMGDYDQWTSLYYGIQQALLKCNTAKDHTTILFVVGNYGDFSRFTPRKAKSRGKKTLVEADQIIEQLANLSVNLIAVQPRNNPDVEAEAFIQQTRNLILQSAVTQHEKYKKIDKITSDVNVSNPSIPTDDNLNDFRLSGGSNVGQVKRPARGGTFSIRQFQDIISENMTQIARQHQNTEEMLGKLLDDGAPIRSVSAGVLEGTIAQKLLDLQLSQQLSQDDLIKLVREKYKLYAEAYMPLRFPGAKHPAMSYVLFMPQDDLESYINELNNLLVCKDRGIAEQRKCLYNWLMNLVEKYGNLSGLSRSNADKVKYEDLMNEYLQGIAISSGFNIIREAGLATNFKIGDIKESKKFTDDQVLQMVGRIEQNTKELYGILQKGAAYEYAYVSGGNTYYWIPVIYTF